MPDAKCCPSSDTEDPREVKAETDPAVTVPVENDIGTLFASPGMKKLFKKNFVTKMVYYEKLNFFDTQLAFDRIFDTQPRIYHAFENDEDARNAKR